MIVLGVIPARAGSKRLPGKNLKKLCGKPLLGWTIDAARRSRALTRLLVSTEDKRTAAAARRLGAEAPFLRPPELATDMASSEAVLTHAVRWHEASTGKKVDIAVLLQPTSPLRRAGDIKAAVRLVAGGADSAETVALDRTHSRHHSTLEANGRLTPARAAGEGPLYRPTGAVYAVLARILLGTGSVRGRDHRAVVQPYEDSIDIDDAWDYELARLILLRRLRGAGV